MHEKEAINWEMSYFNSPNGTTESANKNNPTSRWKKRQRKYFSQQKQRLRKVTFWIREIDESSIRVTSKTNQLKWRLLK